MKIEVWSDYVCPFCYIGKRTLEQALDKFPHKDQVEVTFKSFELDPEAKTNPDVSLDEALAKKYGMTVEQARQSNKQIIARAAEVGLAYNFDKIKLLNTLDAHRLAKYAESRGKGAEMSEKLLSAHFTESEFIGDRDTLVKLAVEVGLDAGETRNVLNGNDYTDQVRADEAEAAQLGVRGVPFFVLNRKYAISGAQPLELFADTLQEVWEEERPASPLKQIGSADGGVCTDESCDL